MSKLDELIREYCPDGVEYKTLGQVAHYAKNRIDADAVTENTYVGVENLLQNKAGKTVAVSVPTKGTVIAFNPHDILIGNIRPYLKKIWLSDCAGGTNGDVLVIQIDERERLLPKYLFYVLSSDRFFLYDMQNSKGAKMPRGNKAAILKYRIPVPPLPVQGEIVRILDNFTELTAELTARKKQYEYYRDKLLTYNYDVELFNISDIAETSIGLATSVSQHKRENGVILLHNSDIQQNKIVLKTVEYISKEFAQKNKKKILRKGDIITVHTGDVGTSAVIDDEYDGAIGFTTITTRIKDTARVNPYFLCHYLNSHKCKQDIASMTISDRSNLNQKSFDTIQIPVPSLEIQERLVQVLDNFDAICSDLKIGLPAEIKARKKQYEYYRDQLLTFAESGRMLVDRQTDRQTALNAIKLIQYVFGWVEIELGMIGKVSMCKRILKSETNTENGVPFYKIGTFGKHADAYVSREKFEEYKTRYSYPKKGDVLISAAGTIGRTVVYNGEDAYYQDSNIVWIANDEQIVLNSYLRYVYQLQPWVASNGGTIARLYNDNISRAKVRIPSLREQARIVHILDRFDALTTDIAHGLPAEIEARRKQYEYYRDKLLTFKERKG